MKKNFNHIPKLDDYELPAEYPLDPAKMKPNRFARRAKTTRGKQHTGAGHQAAPEPLDAHASEQTR
jgi:hypothetical protein